MRLVNPPVGLDLDALMCTWEEREWFGCFYCDGPLTDMQLDHVIPLARGGADDASNLVPSCAGCNLAKSDRPAVFLFASGRS